MKSISVLAAMFAANCAAVAAHHPMGSLYGRKEMTIPKIQPPMFNQFTYQGCFNSSGHLKLNTTRKGSGDMMDFGRGPEKDVGVTEGNCLDFCGDKGLGKGVFALHAGAECWCGDEYPPESAFTDIKYCNIPCSGYDLMYCKSLRLVEPYPINR